MEIKPIGRLLQTNAEGYIQSESSLEKVVDPWKSAVNDLVEQVYLDERVQPYIHSVYVRGTVSRGEAIEDVSDVDTFAVVTAKTDSFDRSWIRATRLELEAKHDFCDGLEVAFVFLDELLENEDFFEHRFLIKTQCVCVYGIDLAPQLDPFRADLATARHFHKNLDMILENARGYIADPEDENDLKDACRWVMKRILRAGFVLVMHKEQAFTRDLYPSYEIFSRYYPEKEPEMKQALEWALDPVTDQAALRAFIDTFGEWVREERERVLG